MEFGRHRCCGILLHPTSLPGPHGIGCLGPEARSFIDFLHDAGQSVWQVLPLGPTGYGDSPYASFSTFAGNPLLIDLDALVADGIIEPDELRDAPGAASRVDYGAVTAFKLPLLARAATRFNARAPGERRLAFEAFCPRSTAGGSKTSPCTLPSNGAQSFRPFNEWDEPLRHRQPDALRQAREEARHGPARGARATVLLLLAVARAACLRPLARRADSRRHPDFPSRTTAPMSWAHPDLFKLDSELRPAVVAGVPPDYFSATGQLWGKPVVRLGSAMKRPASPGGSTACALNLLMADVVRLDHFRGFEARLGSAGRAHHRAARHLGSGSGRRPSSTPYANASAPCPSWPKTLA